MPTTNTQALALIQKCQEEQDDFLDLGDLGLRAIPEEVFTLQHLKYLNLGTHYYLEGDWEASDNEGNPNFIIELDDRLGELLQLEGLFLAKNPITMCKWNEIAPKLKVLDLSYTQLEAYQPVFELAHLEVLKLSGNKLKDLDFLPNCHYHALQVLDLSHNHLHHLKALEIFPNLRILNASINLLRDTQDFPLLLVLEELYLGGNFLHQVDELDQLPILGKISLGFMGMDIEAFFRNRPRHNANFLQRWPHWRQPEKLKTIDFQGNFLSEIPDLGQYTSLSELSLGQNRLSELGGIFGAKALKVLTLGARNPTQYIGENYHHRNLPKPLKNSFRRLDELVQLSALEELFLDGLGLTEIPIGLTFGQLKVLDISSNQISEIKNLDQLTQLQSLSLDNNQISEIKNLNQLTQLQSLSLSINQISEIKNLDQLTQLQDLYLDNNPISEIKNLDQLTQLRSLGLGDNQISEIKNLDQLTQLHSLALGDNLIAEIKNLDQLAQLKYLFLYRNQISEIKNLGQLAQLDTLYLFGNQITQIENLDQLTQLHLLGLDDNQISEIKNLGQLAQLHFLYLSDNQISEIKNLDQLTQLHFLSLGSNQISEIKNLDQLAQLQELSLDNNQILEIKNLNQLTQLQELSLDNNQILEIKNLDQLTQLQSLYLGNNPISEIKNLDQLTQLQSLSLDNNQISEIKNLDQLTHLQSFSLDNNQISEIKNLDQLTHLQSLSLDNNQISEIKNLDHLTYLQSLSLDNNKISEIKNLEFKEYLCVLSLVDNKLKTLKNFETSQYLLYLDFGKNELEQMVENLLNHSSLIHLGFAGNPVVNIPSEIINQSNCLEDARSWFKDLHNKSEFSHEAKLILIGNGRVGKTCVLKRLFYDTYDVGEKSTHGIALYNQEFEWVDAPYKVKLNSWDFGGQELYHATHRLFMQSRALYLAVWDYQTEYLETHKVDEILGIPFRNHPLHYWLENARSLSPQAPIVLVQNKMDRDGPQALHNLTQLQERFKTAESYHVSAEKGTRIGTLKEVVREIILNMPEIGMKVPAQWMRVRDNILAQKEARKTITQVEFWDWCQAEGLSEASTGALLRFLHNTGNLFYHPDLHDSVIILDQEWVLEGIYAIFKRQSPFLSQLYNARGLTDLLALEQPWSQFQPEVRMLFLSMMESCEICFQVTEDKQAPKYLIPECLQPEEPEIIDYVWTKVEAHEYRLLYQHDFIHPAFMVRFICRAGRMAKSLDRIWRDGIWITYKKYTQALIRAFPEQQQLEVRVRGQHAALLLFLIHKEFRGIFYDTKAIGILVSVGEEEPEIYYHPKAKAQPIKGKRQDYFKEILNPDSEELAQKTLKEIVPPPLKTDEQNVSVPAADRLKKIQAKLKKALIKDLEEGIAIFRSVVRDQGVLDDITLQESRFNTIKKDRMKGILNYDEYLQHHSKLMDALTTMVADLEEEELDEVRAEEIIKVSK